MSVKIQFPENFIFSNKHNLGYVSIPKCGCSTIKKHLRRIEDPGDSCQSVHDLSASTLITGNNLSTKEFEHRLSTSLIFSVIRDPRSRILSAYLDKFKSGYLPNLKTFVPQLIEKQLGPEFDFQSFASSLTFLDFLEYIAKAKNKNEHWRPYSETLNPIFIRNVPLKLGKLSELSTFINSIVKSASLNDTEEGLASMNSPTTIVNSVVHKTDADSRLNEFFDTESVCNLFEKLYKTDIEIWSSVQ